VSPRQNSALSAIDKKGSVPIQMAFWIHSATNSLDAEDILTFVIPRGMPRGRGAHSASCRPLVLFSGVCHRKLDVVLPDPAQHKGRLDFPRVRTRG
jgi:hypothetical protein